MATDLVAGTAVPILSFVYCDSSILARWPTVLDCRAIAANIDAAPTIISGPNNVCDVLCDDNNSSCRRILVTSAGIAFLGVLVNSKPTKHKRESEFADA
jgi:hypothetical protein